MERTPAWPRSPEARQVAEAIEGMRFKALSTGIGLGDLKPQTANPASKPQVKMPSMAPIPVPMPVAKPAQKPKKGARRSPTAAARPGDDVRVPRPAPQRPQPLDWTRRLFAWSLDFCFVVLSLAVALSLAAVLTAVHGGEPENWLDLKPLKWLVSTNPVVILVSIYGSFLAYGLLFKILAGRTVGESLLIRRAMTSRNSVKERA